jgi:hypothetical protein
MLTGKMKNIEIKTNYEMKFCKTQVEIDIALEKAVFLTPHKRSTAFTMHIEKSSTY